MNHMAARIEIGDPAEWEDIDHPVVSSMIGSTRDSVLKGAGDLINGDRARDYGDAYSMHKRIAAGWSEILGVEVKPHQVALCMAWLKVSRLVETPGHKDSYVDLVAYGALAAEIQERDSRERE
jgi:hypothetical protein